MNQQIPTVNSSATPKLSVFWLQWQRRWRLSEMRLLFLALVVSVMAVSSVGFFTDRVDKAMLKQATRLLGGDIVVDSPRPLPDQYRQIAQQEGLQRAEVTSFTSMASKADQLQLARIKAVSKEYPLQGQLEVSDQLVTTGTAVDELPAAGEAWAELRLFTELDAKPGDRIQLGRSEFILSKVLTKDPSRGTNLFQLAPQIIINLDDLAATGLLSPASRAKYELLFTGDNGSVRSFREQLEPLLQPSEEIESLDNGVPTVQNALQRAGRFLGLAALLSVVLAGVAIALTAASLVRHETKPVAVLKAFGLPRRTILLDYLANLWIVALLAAAAGLLIGFALQFVLAGWLAEFVDIELPAPGAYPLLTGLLTALIMVTGFALPHLLRLVETSPMQILQGALHSAGSLVWLVVAGIVPAVFALLWLQAGELRLAVWLFGGIALALLLFWLAATAFLKAVTRLSLRRGWEWLALLRHSRRAALLVVVFATGLFTLLLLTVLRTDLIERWQDTLPENAPNYFLINIQPAEVEPLQNFLGQRDIEADLYPMIRGRLVGINGEPASADTVENPEARRLFTRELNLSSFAGLPDSNLLQQGKWFDGQSTAGFSVEESVAERLGVGVGDSLSFDIAGVDFTETISSIREVRWDSMQPNFFVIAAPGALEDKPQTFITSLYIDPAQTSTVPDMIRQFPGITAIDTGAIVEQVRSLIDQATFAVQGIFVFTLITGIIVLLAALQSQKADRRREIAVLKSLGAVHGVLKRRIWVEFTLLGALSGLLAALFTLLASNILGAYLFELQVSINVWVLLFGTLAGAVMVSVAAWFNLRGLLDITPVALLKG
ncbi:MAG: FtsX-like permease family protein [Thiolinea sp.]